MNMNGSQDKSNETLSIDFCLSITPQEYQKYYRGLVKWVLAKSSSGLKIRFPAAMLSAHITHNGINGRFVLEYTIQGKAVSLRQIA